MDFEILILCNYLLNKEVNTMPSKMNCLVLLCKSRKFILIGTVVVLVCCKCNYIVLYRTYRIHRISYNLCVKPVL